MVPRQLADARPTALQSASRQARTSSAENRAPDGLRRDLEAVFNAGIMAHAQWAVVVRSLATGERLYERNPHKLMVPASNMKVITLAAAAREIGWDARFTTTLETQAPIEAGVLRGDLYVRGGGDPTINSRNGRAAAVFAEWIAALTAAGVHQIDGRIIGDDDLFDDESLGAGWAWDYLEADYAAPVGALQYNENVVELTVLPGSAAGEPALASLGTGSGLTLVNRAVTSTEDQPETIGVRRRLDRLVLEVSGTVPLPAAAPARTVGRRVAVVNPTRFFAGALRDALIAGGLAVSGDAVDIDEVQPAASELAAAHRRVLARAESPLLRDIAAVMMKASQNLYAEAMLKATGVAASGAGTAAAGRAAVTAMLQDWQIDPRSLVMVDGSGLSRYGYVSAELMTSVLERLHADPRHRDAFTATLAIAGRDGTVLNRLRGTRAEGNARVKTGSISNMRSLSGYVHTRDGEPLVFSVVANDFAIPAATVNWIADLAVEILANFTRR